MGMDLKVRFANSASPPWPLVADLLQARGWPVSMRMIDNELAFPDESPPEGWRELRVGAEGAMVTIRRAGPDIVLVAWGNADPAQQRLWHRLAWAFATAGAGSVVGEMGTKTPAEFAAETGLEG